jgi:hypothetical protein
MTQFTEASPDDFDGLRFIGEMTTRWVSMEIYVKTLVGMLVTPEPEMGRTLTWDASWSWLNQYLKPVIKQRTGNDLDALEEATMALSALDDLDKHRNRLIHSTMEPLANEAGDIEWPGLKPRGKDPSESPLAQTVWTTDEVTVVKAKYNNARTSLYHLTSYLLAKKYLHEWPLWHFPPIHPWD